MLSSLSFPSCTLSRGIAYSSALIGTLAIALAIISFAGVLHGKGLTARIGEALGPVGTPIMASGGVGLTLLATTLLFSPDEKKKLDEPN